MIKEDNEILLIQVITKAIPKQFSQIMFLLPPPMGIFICNKHGSLTIQKQAYYWPTHEVVREAIPQSYI